jgi:hypothetical protein
MARFREGEEKVIKAKKKEETAPLSHLVRVHSEHTGAAVWRAPAVSHRLKAADSLQASTTATAA